MSNSKNKDDGNLAGVSKNEAGGGNPPAGPDNEVQELISAYEQSKKKAAVASRSVGALVLTVLTANAIFAIFATIGFFNYRIPEFTMAFAGGMTPVAHKYWPEIKDAFDRLVPVYITAFEKSAQRRLPDLKKRMQAELDGLEAYGAQQRPEIKNRFDSMTSARQQDFVDGFQQAVGHPVSLEDLQSLTDMYRQALSSKADQIWLRNYLDYKDAAKHFETSLTELSQAEPDLNREVSAQEAIGILVQFLGIELQTAK